MEIIKEKDIKLTYLIKLLKEGAVLVIPTDTVYGLICDAKRKKALDHLFTIKQRPRKKPIPIFIKNIQMAKKVSFIDKKQESYLKSVWPGKVTVVLKPRAVFPSGIGKKGKEIGIRIPKYKLLNNLLNLYKVPLTGTSANISGKPASTKINEIIAQFKNKKNKPDLIVDAGNLPLRNPSIIIDLTKEKFKLLRK